MKGTDQVSRVIGVLQDAGYQSVTQPIIIGGIPFEFAAILTKDASLELIAVVDTVLESEQETLRVQVEGLARALDLVGSRRALTVIPVGPLPSQSIAGELKQVARVLSIAAGARDGDEPALEDALAVLLPLELSSAGEDTVSSWPSVRDELRARYPAKEIEPIFRAVPRGPRQVQAALHAALIEPLDVE